MTEFSKQHENQRLTLRPVTFQTVRQVCALSVAPRQAGNVTCNAISIAEAHFEPGAWFRASCLGDTPIGFIMLFDPTVPGATTGRLSNHCIGLWRLMIDHRYQGRGYGKQVLDLTIDHIRSTSKSTSLISSYIPGPDGPEAFYRRYGFTETGQRRANGTEIEIVLDL